MKDRPASVQVQFTESAFSKLTELESCWLLSSGLVQISCWAWAIAASLELDLFCINLIYIALLALLLSRTLILSLKTDLGLK